MKSWIRASRVDDIPTVSAFAIGRSASAGAPCAVAMSPASRTAIDNDVRCLISISPSLRPDGAQPTRVPDPDFPSGAPEYARLYTHARRLLPPNVFGRGHPPV